MSINFCTINGNTINAFCGNRRALVITRLIPILHPPIPAQIGHASGNAVSRRWAEPKQWEPPIVSTERDKIIVTARLDNIFGEDQQNIDNRLDIVFITDINIEPTLVAVNIKNLKIN